MSCTGQASPVEISERLEVLRSRKAAHYVVPDYLAAEWQQSLREASVGVAGVSGPDSFRIEGWRQMICEWCYQVVDHFEFDREVVSVAISHLDRYLATRAVDQRAFQLASMTALYLAIKTCEPGEGEFRMSSLIQLSRDLFVAGDIVAMEVSMLWSLDWHVHPPTPFAFCREFIALVPGIMNPRVHDGLTELARFMTELSVCRYWFATKKPSSIAIGAITNAIELIGSRCINSCCQDQFVHRLVDMGMVNPKDEEIIQCYERLRDLFVAGGYTVYRVTGIDQDDTASPTGVSEG